MNIMAHKQVDEFTTPAGAKSAHQSHHGSPGYLAGDYAIRWTESDPYAVVSFWREGTRPDIPLVPIPIGLQTAATSAMARFVNELCPMTRENQTAGHLPSAIPHEPSHV